MSNLPFEMPVKDVSIHANGIDKTDWVLIDPDAKPKDGDNVLIKDTNRFLILTYLSPYYLAGAEVLMDLTMYDLMGTIIQKSKTQILGEEYYAEVERSAL
jgi:hypothetical protein